MRFDVYAMSGGVAVYAVDVQADFLSHLPTRMVIPIIAELRLKERIRGLHPLVEINGEPFVLVTNQLTSILKRDLKWAITSLTSQRDEITGALDILLTGF